MRDGQHIFHEGVLEKSGRYPWGSGEFPYQRLMRAEGYWKTLSKKGYNEVEIAKMAGFDTVKEFRARKRLVKAELARQRASEIYKLKDKGWSNQAIADKLGLSGESYVRNFLKKGPEAYKKDKTLLAAEKMENLLKEGKMVDFGKGVETHMGISAVTLDSAVEVLRDKGYKVHNFDVPQATNPDQKTNYRVVAPPEMSYYEVTRSAHEAAVPFEYSTDKGVTYKKLEPPKSIDPNRVFIRYAEDGGTEKDGVIELRSGVPDLDLGDSRYAQVRVKVGDNNYMKGMAMRNDDAIPKGYDVVYNTNKTKDTPMLGSKADGPVLKVMSDDPDLPFGSMIKRQQYHTDKNGKEQLTALNIVNEEGDWAEWSRTLSSQMLSKQNVSLAKKQLDLSLATKVAEFNDIQSLSNPTVKARLLRSFADSADSESVHLKAAALPRQQTKVILPVPKLKENEIYAPGFEHGEEVALVRFPHGGIFEIPTLKVNNRQRDATKVLKGAVDAVGINPIVAEQLSGADFDGDTVLVIPQKSTTKLKTKPPLKALEGFDPKERYKGEPGKFKPMTNTQTEMGKISNLITDMTIRGASDDEIARAVKHSMVVIDAEKHGLDYTQSAKDNRIAELKRQYQSNPDGSSGGASTLISRASGRAYVPHRKPRLAKDGGPIDPKTGAKVYVETGDTRSTKKGGEWVKVPKETRTTQMDTVDDAHALSSGTSIETLYANHANQMKALGNAARKELLATPKLERNPEARIKYKAEVDSIKAKLDLAYMNKPLERKAQALANETVRLKKEDNPQLSDDYDALKKVRTRALADARAAVGASRSPVEINDREWEAIQAGAVSDNRLREVLDNTDVDKLKERALPKTSRGMTPAMEALAKSYYRRGYSLEDIARHLGISPSTVSRTVSPKAK